MSILIIAVSHKMEIFKKKNIYVTVRGTRTRHSQTLSHVFMWHYLPAMINMHRRKRLLIVDTLIYIYITFLHPLTSQKLAAVRWPHTRHSQIFKKTKKNSIL